MKTPIKLLGSTLCAALLLTAPGPLATQAFAVVIKAKVAPITSVPGSIGAVSLGSLAPGAAIPSLNLVNPLAQNLPGLPSVNIQPAVAHTAAPAAQELPKAQGRPTHAQVLPSARRTLATGAAKIEKAKGSSDKFAALKSLFTGSQKTSPAEVLFSAGDLGEAAPISGLSRLTVGDLEAIATDSRKDPKERASAVSSISKQGDKAALVRVSEANPEGTAADYEIHRAALKALAQDHGDIRSLRPVSRAHADEILKKLENDKPEEAFFDYDDTLAEFNQPISKETGAAIKSAADAGVEPIILTDRPDVRKRETDVTITDSLSGLTPEQKRALTLVSSRGTRTLLYDRKGEAVLVRETPVKWTDAENAAILAARQAFLDHYGSKKDGSPVAQQEYNGKTHELNDYSYAHFLPIGWKAEAVKEAAALFQSELKARGVDFSVTGRTAKKDTDPPYMSLSKIDKRTGVIPLRANIRAIDQVKDFLRIGMPGRFARAAWKAVNFFPKHSVPTANTLSVGDQFFDMRIADIGFVKASPGALVISVGGTADPRLENIFVWPSEGQPASLEILQALGRKAPSEMNKKAVVGMFAQRTASIAVFILTTIAYPFIAVPVVGWAGYGALMAFGPLAAIATGPLNGLIVDRLSARNAMALNTVVRVVLALILPILAALGILNFWSLFIASIANGWLLSSVMTTEGAYVKRLAGYKNVGTVNGLLWMNYLFIQVLLGLIVGIGAVIDTWNPMVAFYLTAIVNAGIVLPIIWWTMPNLSPSPKTLDEKTPTATLALRGIGKFLLKNVKPILAFTSTVGLYLLMNSALPIVGTIAAALPMVAVKFLSSTIPIIGGLVYWITTLDSFKSLWYGRGGEPSVEQKGLEDKIAANQKAISEGAENSDALRAENKKLKGQVRNWHNRLRTAMLFIALSALLMYPLQYYGLPNIASTLVGAEAKGLLLGQLLGSLFFGNLLANAAKTKLGNLKLPLLGRIAGHRLIHLAVAALGATWVYTGLFPGSLLAAGIALLGALGIMELASRVTDRGWLKLYGAGFAGIWLPYLAWTTGFLSLPVSAALMISLLMIGMVYGPGFVSLISYFHRNAAQGNMGKSVGVQGSFFNAAISLGYGTIALGAALVAPAFPGLLLPLGIAYAIGGLLFWFAPDRLPGFPKTILHPRDKK